jgi:ligand-binding SRPBCC domain-containing protein
MLDISHTPAGYLLATEQWLPGAPADVFAFFADARNLERITPPWLNFYIVSDASAVLQAGSLIDYRLRLHGIPFSWRTEISVWEPGVRFVDRQLRGPYRRWVHEHTFEPQAGGTLMRDRVDYAPLGGALAQWLLVERDLRRIFSYRREQIEALLGRAT